ncbi:nucleotide exchange factor GrpE [Rarobacter faecitabidus]|uniref:Protein GrpE n=1 Tax=Rarobacter faecitabidus TaxID=13243 RepID=A0A542ZAL1_RARFA|nr:nucleotide exchange factor GrpE [Rarobacter faecitabidus]TQL57374.1 molecular chaperone GrpE [Rarobacter faecitabidus]
MSEENQGHDPNEDEAPFHFVDNRRFDPETGDVREGAGSADKAGSAPGGGEVDEDSIEHLDFEPPSDELAAAQQRADELLEDLQRERASFTNYRNRSLRDQQAARTRGVEDVLTALLPALDDLARARQHEELEGPFAAIADKLVAALGKFEVESFGAVGEEFDPTLHEALMHQPDEDAAAITVTHVIAPGYKIGDKVVRAAQVAVSGPQQ